jgi:acyl carrier protein
MITFDEVKVVIGDVLQLDEERIQQWERSTGLLGSLSEFDSTTVIALISALEARFAIVIEDDEISAEVFETVGNVYEFVRSKRVVQNASPP